MPTERREQPIRRFAPANLRAALWGLRALRQVRFDVRFDGIETARPPAPGPLPVGAERGVRAVLRGWRATCLERALVLQSWRAAHDDPRDLVIAVGTRGGGLRAHAWLDGEDRCHEGEFSELLRRPAGVNGVGAEAGGQSRR